MTSARVVLWGATWLALAVIARSWFFGLAGMWAAGALVSLVLVYGLGVRYPNWGMLGDVLTRAPQPEPGVALTFEVVGPGDASSTLPEVLEVLARYGHRATFLIDPSTQQDAACLARIAAEGHQLGLCVGAGVRAHGLWRARALVQHMADQREWLEQSSGATVGLVRFAARWVGPAAYHAAQRCGLLAVGYAVELGRGHDGGRQLCAGRVIAVRPRQTWHRASVEDLDALRALCEELRQSKLPSRVIADYLEA